MGSRADAGPRRGTDHQFVHQVQHLNPLLAVTPRTGAQQIAPVPSQSSASPPPVYARNGRLLQCHYCRGNHKQHVCPVLQRDAAHVPASRPTSSVGRQNGFACGGPGLLPTPLICVGADGGQAKPGAGHMGPCLLPAARRLCPGRPWWRAASRRHRRRQSAQSAAPLPSAARHDRGRQCGSVYPDAGLRTMQKLDGYLLVHVPESAAAGDLFTAKTPSGTAWTFKVPATLPEDRIIELHPPDFKDRQGQRCTMSAAPSFDAPTAEELDLHRQGTPMRLAAALSP